MDVGPHRDLVGELSDSVHAAGLTMGLYHSLREWYNPIFLEVRIHLSAILYSNNGFYHHFVRLYPLEVDSEFLESDLFSKILLPVSHAKSSIICNCSPASTISSCQPSVFCILQKKSHLCPLYGNIENCTEK